jgi:hypothetical protein
VRFSNICRLGCLFLFRLLNTSFTTWLWKDKWTTTIKWSSVHDFFSIIDVFFSISEAFLGFLYNFNRIPIGTTELMLLIKVLLLLLLLLLELLLLSIELIEKEDLRRNQRLYAENHSYEEFEISCSVTSCLQNLSRTSWWSQMCCLTIDTLCRRAIIYLRHILILIIRG